MFNLTKTNASSLNEWFSGLQEFQLDSYFESNILGRSYDYISSVALSQVNEDRRTYKLVSSKVYEVEIKKVSNEILGSCTCPYDEACKHLAAVIL